MIHLDFLPEEIYKNIYKYVMDIAIRDAVRSVLREKITSIR